MRNLLDLDGKVAIVTGAIGGMGSAISCLLAAYGADIVAADIDLSAAQKLEDTIKNFGRNCLPLQVDLTNAQEVETLVQKTLSTYGAIDILVNNAGITNRKSALDLTPEEWDSLMEINLKAVFLCSQGVGRIMIKQARGRIVNISSTVGIQGNPNRSAYAASKGGVILLTKVLANEWGPFNVNVNAIAPGFTETPMTKTFLGDPTNRTQFLSRIPLGRFAKTEEIAAAVLFLASEASSYITGHTLVVDGGSLIT
ncbi:MAG: hypothetical protein A2157_04405 [Deltaproteobacteria bacterium RBG_16_47_11]|nr:MAG: hypothetical protein A2157_04405 [Deltaproteobacteria bacterium RBG_16_47_11]